MTTVTTREFLHNFSSIKSSQEAVVIANRKKLEGVFVPYEIWEKMQHPGKKIDIKALAPYFIEGPKELSKEVDSVYV